MEADFDRVMMEHDERERRKMLIEWIEGKLGE